MDEIYEKAKGILEKKARQEVCIKAMLCPDCGSKLEYDDCGEQVEVVCKHCYAGEFTELPIRIFGRTLHIFKFPKVKVWHTLD